MLAASEQQCERRLAVHRALFFRRRFDTQDCALSEFLPPFPLSVMRLLTVNIIQATRYSHNLGRGYTLPRNGDTQVWPGLQGAAPHAKHLQLHSSLPHSQGGSNETRFSAFLMASDLRTWSHQLGHTLALLSEGVGGSGCTHATHALVWPLFPIANCSPRAQDARAEARAGTERSIDTAQPATGNTRQPEA